MKSKLFTGLLALVLSFALWTYVVTVISPNSDKQFRDVQVVLSGEAALHERGLMITNKEISTVALHLEGNRVDLDALNSANITLTADVSKIYDAGTHTLRFTPNYPGDITTSDIKVLTQSPSTVKVTVEERNTKAVPVEVRYSGNLPENFMADKDNVTLDFTTVNITGPKSVTDRITAACLDVDLEGKMEKIDGVFPYTLCDKDGKPVDASLVTTDVEAVSLSLRIVRVKEIALVVEIVDGGGATKDTTSITQDYETIRISGSDSLLEGIEKLDVGTVNLAEVLEDGVMKFPIKLPEGVTNETGVAEVTVDIRFPDLDIRKFSISDIQAVNVPQGMEVELITQVLDITVRGPKQQVEALTEEDITVTVNCKNMQPGTAAVKAEIIIKDEGIGAMGAYNVTATLREKSAEGTENGAAG